MSTEQQNNIRNNIDQIVDEQASEKESSENDDPSDLDQIDKLGVLPTPKAQTVLPSTVPEDAQVPEADNGVLEEHGGLPTSGTGEEMCVRFQLIPISETPGKAAVGEVVERKLKEKDTIKLGRQVVRDGQATIKGNKKATELDVWFSSKVVSRLHAEIWVKDGQLCVKDVGSSSGTFLNQMRLSPSGKDSRPYPLKQGDVLQFGVDFKGKSETDIYRAIVMKLGFHDQAWLRAQKKNANPQRFSAALKQMISATNPYAEKKGEDATDSTDVDCCICIGPIAPYQALFFAPCSHCYHFKCVAYLVSQTPMFQCPLCRQVANLTASVSSESLTDANKITVPLPVLEEELDAKKKEEDRLLLIQQNADRKSTSRNTGLSAGKRILENLGLLSPRSITTAEELPSGGSPLSSPGPLSPGTGLAGIESKNGTKKRTFSFRLRSLAGVTKKEDVPRTAEPKPAEEIPSPQGGPSSSDARHILLPSDARHILDGPEPSGNSQPQH